MKKKKVTEQELLKGLDAESVHADELAEPLAHKLTPLERLNGAVIRDERPLDSVWDDYFDSDDGGVTDDFMEERDCSGSMIPDSIFRVSITALKRVFGQTEAAPRLSATTKILTEPPCQSQLRTTQQQI